MKKILVYGFTYNMGGIESFYMNYYRKLDKKEYQIDFVKSYDKIAFEDELVANGSRMFRLPKYNQNPILFYREITKLFKQEKYDVFHANMLTAANIVHLKAAKKCGVKTIIAHSHNNDCVDGKMKNAIHYLNRKCIKRYANCFLTCSVEAGKWLFDKKIKPEVMKNAIDLKRYEFCPEKRNILRKELRLEHDFVIGNVGRFAKQKNHEYLMDVFYECKKRISNAKLLLVGTGVLESEMKQKAKAWNLEDSVLFLGKRENVFELYQAMDCFLFPSIFEGLGIVGIEAQANGLPCIFSNKIPEETKMNSNVSVLGIEKEDLTKWRDKVLEIKENGKRCTDLKKLYENYDIDCEIEKLKELYEN